MPGYVYIIMFCFREADERDLTNSGSQRRNEAQKHQPTVKG